MSVGAELVVSATAVEVAAGELPADAMGSSWLGPSELVYASVEDSDSSASLGSCVGS